MKKIFLSLAVVVFFSPYLWAEKEKSGEVTISYMEGEVEVMLTGAKDWAKAKLYGKLKKEDRIRTKLQSKAELKLSNGSTINITENSIMDIKELFEKGDTTKSSFKVWMGGIKARFERLKTKDSEVKFYTPTAVMGLRGTTVWLEVDWEGKTKCAFESGNGYIYSDKDGEQPVGEGEEANVSLEGDITITKLQMKTVPNVVGMLVNAAKSAIVDAGLRVGEISAQENIIVPPNTVLSQFPPAGESKVANTSVSLVVASEVPPVIVPDVIGMTKDLAKTTIEAAGLVLGMITEVTSNRPENEVLKQNPEPGIAVKRESPVNIMVSKRLPIVGIPNIFHQFSISGLFVNEIPYLMLNITPTDYSPLFIQVMGKLVKLNTPPYFVNFKPPVMSNGVNNIDVSAWFEGGNKVNKVIETPYYDPLSPNIVNVRGVKNERKIRVMAEDNESGIKNVKINGVNAAITDSTQEERARRNVFIKGSYEEVINFPVDKDGKITKPTIRVNIEVEDNAGNKRTRTESIATAGFDIPSPDQIPK